MISHAGFDDAQTALEFLQGGKATVTFTSATSGKHFTYRVDQGADKRDPERKTPFFVKVLNGPNNAWNGDWLYIGYIKADGNSCLLAGAKGHPDADSFKAFSWVWAHLNRGDIPEDLTIQHDGTCCICRKQLTDPVSVATGIGPICAGRE